MNRIQICEICLDTFKPELVNGIGVLKEFQGYTVDLRLQQFRKAKFGEELVFIEFDSDEGQEILRKMHLSVVN